MAPSVLALNTYRSERFGFGIDITYKWVLQDKAMGKKVSVANTMSFDIFYRYHENAIWGSAFPDLRTHYVANQVGFAFNPYAFRIVLSDYFIDVGAGLGFRKSYFNTENAENDFAATGNGSWAGRTGPFVRAQLTLGYLYKRNL